MGTANYLTAAYNAVSANEVSGNPAIADRVSTPVPSGTSGWTIGFNQEDFNTNPTQAQNTLTAALTASGSFDPENVSNIATALTAAGTSQTVNLSGITDINGNPATLASINAALQTPTAAASIAGSSLSDFTTAFNALNTNVLQSPDLTSGVQNALADPTYGSLLTAVLADYNNQYPGGITSGGNMMTLLTAGSVTLQSGAVITLDTTNAATVTQSIMTLALSTQWVANGFGAQATSRLANDVAAAVAYDSANGITPPSGNITLSSAYGDATISPSADGATFSGSWLDGAFSGIAQGDHGAILDVSGLNNTFDLANGDAINLANGASAAINGSSATITDTTSGGANILDLSGLNNTIDLGNSTINLDGGTSTTLNGNSNTIGLGAGDTLGINGSSNNANISGAGNSVGSGTTAVVGPLEKLSFSTIEVDVAQGTQATVTGTDGTMTANNESGGTTIANEINWSAGGSQQQELSGLGSGIGELVNNYTGANLTGTLHDGIVDYTAGNSTDVIAAGLPSGVTNEYVYYTGLNDAGTLYQESSNYTSGDSVLEEFNPTGGISTETLTYSGLNDSGTDTQNVIEWNAGGSQEQLFTGLSSGVTDEYMDYLGANLTGTEHDVIATYSTPIAGYATGSSIETVLSGLASGVSYVNEYFSTANATGTNYQTNTNYTAGNSQVEFFNPTGTIATEFEDTTSANGGGTDTENIINWNAGGSQQQMFASLPSGVNEEVSNYSGANDTGTLHDEIVDYTTGTSTDVIVGGLPGGVYDEFAYYTGQNDTGTLTQENTNYTAGNSVLEQFNPTGNISQRYEDFSGQNDTGTDTENILNFTNGFSQEQLLTGLPSGVSSEYSDYNSTNLTGTLLNGIVNYNAGTSTEIVVSGLPANVSDQYDYFSMQGAQGLETDSTANLTNGEVMQIAYTYSGSTLEGSIANFYSGGSKIGTAVYGASGGYVEGNGGGAFASDGDATGDESGDDFGGGDGGFDGGYELTTSAKAGGTNIGVIAQSDASLAPNAAIAAENAQFGITALSQLLSSGATNINTPFFEGAKWNSKVITWSLAASPGTAGSPFSGYMGAQYAALVQQAFQAWGAASGITFEQIADSSNSDIRLGWGDFNTASSGVVGYTSYQNQNGQLQPNVIIRLEDPSQNALVGGANNTLTYSGTQANLYQVILHEIGHALGLSDNVDPNSVMYYQANGNPGTLDNNDIEGMQMLYGTAKPSFATPSTVPSTLAASEAQINSMLQQMIQAAAAFNTQQSALTSFVLPETIVPPILAAAQAQH